MEPILEVLNNTGVIAILTFLASRLPEFFDRRAKRNWEAKKQKYTEKERVRNSYENAIRHLNFMASQEYPKWVKEEDRIQFLLRTHDALSTLSIHINSHFKKEDVDKFEQGIKGLLNFGSFIEADRLRLLIMQLQKKDNILNL